MTKPRHDEPTSSSRNSLIVLVIGGLLVAGLVGWALTRTVTPAPSVMDTAPSTTQATATAPVSVETAQSSTSTAPPHDHEADAAVPRISVEDARELQKSGAVTVVDVRAADAFAREHIPGSMNVPYASIESFVDMIPKGKPIVTVCT